MTALLVGSTIVGIQVRMLLHSLGGHVSVAVEDTKTGEMFDVPVGDDDPPLDVFHHPYASAAMRCQLSDGSVPASAVTALAAWDSVTASGSRTA